MKTAKTTTTSQRRVVEEKLKQLKSLVNTTMPRSGWLKAVRGALGLTTRRLAALLKTDMAAVVRMEKREINGAVTLESLDRVARAMGCRLVYAIVPDIQYGSLESILDERARVLARKLAKDVSHSMRLENQGVDSSTTEAQIERLAQDLKTKLDPRLWEK